MNNYCGNREPFIYVYMNEAKKQDAEGFTSALSKKHKVYVSSHFGKKDKAVLKKAGAALLFLDRESISELEPVVAFAANENKEMIPVFLDAMEEVNLPAGMSMLLGTKQAHVRSRYDSEDGFTEALLASPVLAGLNVTPEQKAAARNRMLFGAAAVIAVVVLTAFLVLGGQGSAEIPEDSALAKAGISGKVSDVHNVYYYGSQLQDKFEEYGAQRTEGDDGSIQIYLPETDAYVSQGTFTDASDFSQLNNLEELAIAGNAIPDIAPILKCTKLKKLDFSANMKPLSVKGISGLKELEYLNLAYCPLSGDLSELKELKNLKTLIISQDNEALVDALGKVDFEVLYTERNVTNWEELQTASDLPYVYKIHLTGNEIEVPKGKKATIRKNVILDSGKDNPDIAFNIHGELDLCGKTFLASKKIINDGTITVRDGGDWHGAGGAVTSSGQFNVEEGGRHLLDLGEEFFLTDGEYNNAGELNIKGGSFTWEGGNLINNGTIIVNAIAEDGTVPLFFGDLSKATGTGQIKTADGNKVAAEDLAAPGPEVSEKLAGLLAMKDDPDDLDDNGMTPRERAIFDYISSLDHADIGNTQQTMVPFVDKDKLDIVQTARNGESYLARDMTLDKAPAFYYKEGGIWNFNVAPGATVTIEGGADKWIRDNPNPGDDENDICFTVHEGGTLIINGELPFSEAVNHGTLIVNGKLYTTHYESKWGDRLAYLANDGQITVGDGGSLDARQVWSFKGAEEKGTITLHDDEGKPRYDYTDVDCPFTFDWGVHGFRGFRAAVEEPDKKDGMFQDDYFDEWIKKNGGKEH